MKNQKSNVVNALAAFGLKCAREMARELNGGEIAVKWERVPDLPHFINHLQNVEVTPNIPQILIDWLTHDKQFAYEAAAAQAEARKEIEREREQATLKMFA